MVVAHHNPHQEGYPQNSPLEKGGRLGERGGVRQRNGGQAAALQQSGPTPSTGPQGLFGKRLGAPVEPLDFNFLIASTVWLQAPGTQIRRWPISPKRHEAPRHTHPSGEHRALSRDQIAPFLSAFWKPTATPGDGGWRQERWDSQASPYPPHPQPVLQRSGAQWQGGGGREEAQKLGNSLGLVYC